MALMTIQRKDPSVEHVVERSSLCLSSIFQKSAAVIYSTAGQFSSSQSHSWRSGEKETLAGLWKNEPTQPMSIIGIGKYSIIIIQWDFEPKSVNDPCLKSQSDSKVTIELCTKSVLKNHFFTHFRTEKNATQWSKDKLNELLLGFEIKDKAGKWKVTTRF